MGAQLRDFPPLLTLQRDFGGLAGDATKDATADSTITDLTDPFDPPVTPPSTVPSGGVTIGSISTGIDTDGSAHVDLGWTAVDGASSYEVRYKKSSESLYTYVTVATPSIRISNLLPNTSYDFAVQAIGSGGVTSGYGADTTQVTAADSTAPAAPTGLVASPGVRSFTVVYNANTESDFDHYVIEVYGDIGLTSLLRTSSVRATVVAMTDVASQTQYFVRVKAVDTSGNSSAWTGPAAVTTGALVNSDIVAGSISGDIITAATLIGAQIQSGSIHAADAVFATAAIQDADINTLVVDKLTAGTLSAAVTLSGSIKTGTSGLRVEEDASGIRLYGYVAPYVRSYGADGSGTGAVTVPLPAQHLANDILVLVVHTLGSETAPTTPTGYTKKDEISTGSTASDVRLTIFYKRDSGSESAPSLASTTKRQIGFIVAVAGCVTTGDPFDVTATSTDTSSTSASISGVTTTKPNALDLLALATDPSVAVGNTEYTFWTNSNLSLVTEVKESSVYAESTNFGCVGLGAGVAAAVGATGTTTVTLDSASKKAMWSGALLAPIGATVNLDATNGGGSFTGQITGSKFYTPRTTGDRGVLGQAGMGQFIGLGIVTYRNADTAEGPFNVSSLVDATFDHSFPFGAGTGNSSKLWLAAWGSDDGDKSTAARETAPSAEQAAAITLTSGNWKGAIGPSTTPVIDFLFYHYNSTAVQLAADVQMLMYDTSSHISLSGIQTMGDLTFAAQFMQNFANQVTYPGGSVTSTASNITWGTAFVATPTAVASGRGGGSETIKSIFNITAISGSGATIAARDVDAASPGAGTAAAYTIHAGVH